MRLIGKVGVNCCVSIVDLVVVVVGLSMGV